MRGREIVRSKIDTTLSATRKRMARVQRNAVAQTRALFFARALSFHALLLRDWPGSLNFATRARDHARKQYTTCKLVSCFDNNFNI